MGHFKHFFNVKLIPFLLRKNMALLRYLSMFAKRETKRQPKQKCIQMYTVYTQMLQMIFPPVKCMTGRENYKPAQCI